MSDENALAKEIPADAANHAFDLTAIDRNGRDPLVPATAPAPARAAAHAAFSVLWSIEGDETSR